MKDSEFLRKATVIDSGSEPDYCSDLY